ncbi:phage head-tail connector protein [Staphylococcus epidermidis]|nr:phage head-tail connector protein [Staphylococcus epidermidis]
MAVLENVKKLLSINDDKQDELLEIIISNTEKRLISLLPVDIEEVPDRLEYIVEEVAVKRFNRVGAEGMTQESVDGHSNTFQNNDFDEYLDVINALFPKNTSKRGRGVFY